ncbi:hypothetical protein V3H27_12040, partial [Vibrio parahaemolyticus]|uniref:hypothetical protein n=2 Tax=Vibrio parahaemolyticus TaxID=670 RepID=UPI003B670924
NNETNEFYLRPNWLIFNSDNYPARGGRQGAIFAIYGLMANTASPDFLKLDEIREDMKNFESKGRVLPQIALSLKNT